MFLGGIPLDPKITISKSQIDNYLHYISCPKLKSGYYNYKNFGLYILTRDLDSFNFSEYVFYHKESCTRIFIEGNIYNLDDLISELGINKSNSCQPYVVFRAHRKWGKSFVNKLNGDFSICVYQESKKQITFYRDHLGIRPITVAIKDNICWFSSDPMGLSKACYGKERIDKNYLLSKFTFNSGYTYDMPHPNVLKVRAAHYLRISKDNIKQEKYWHPELIKTDHSLTQDKVLRDLKQLLIDSVKIRSDKNKIAGTHLSGGLDSGIVAALARPHYKHQKEFYGFSWSPEEHNKIKEVIFDERVLARKTAKMNDIKLIHTSTDFRSYLSYFSDWRHPSEVMYESKTLQNAALKNIEIIFSGWGGDDFISIGHRGIDADLIKQFHWRSYLRKFPLNKPRDLLRNLVYRVFFPSLRMDYTNYKCETSIYPYIRKAIGKNKISKRERFKYNSRRNVHLQLLEGGHLEARTSDWYVFGQRFGVEYRYPLLDKRIVEYMIKTPSKCLVGNNHYRIILREIGKDLLPLEVLKNKSKNDPLLSQKFGDMVKKIKMSLINEIDDYKKNEDLAFVDFSLLDKNLPEILKNIEDGIEDDGTEILYYLKNVHEFTKGYYS